MTATTTANAPAFVQFSTTFTVPTFQTIASPFPRRPLPKAPPRFVVSAVTRDKERAITEPSPAFTPLPTPALKRSFAFIVDLLRRDFGNLTYSPKYGPVYESKFLGSDLTIVSDLKAIAEIFRENDIFTSSNGAWSKPMETLFGPKTMFLIDGVEHDEKRAVVQPAFTPIMIQSYFQPILDSTYELWDDISKEIDQRDSTRLLSFMKDHFLRIIIRITAGLDASRVEKHTFIRLRNLYVRFEGGIFTFPFGPIWNNALQAREELLKVYDETIRQRLIRDANIIEKLRASADDFSKFARKDLQEGAIDILNVAIASSPLKTGPGQQHNQVELNEIAELMLLLWFAGYSTQASTILSCIMELGFDESIRKQLQSEQDQLIASAGTEELNMNQVLKEMPLLDSYISEILRLYPPAAIIPRLVSRDTVVCGHLLKEGTRVGLDLWWAQRDRKYFEDGDVLKLDRFAGQNSPLAVSFGANGGSHYCLGAALAKAGLKITLAVLLREYKFELDAKQSRRYVSVPAVQPESGVKLVKCKRKEE